MDRRIVEKEGGGENGERMQDYAEMEDHVIGEAVRILVGRVAWIELVHV
jgi:hypothetical protein